MPGWLEVALLVLVGGALLVWFAGVRYIPHNKVGVIEKMWSLRGSLAGGRLIATGGEAGFEAAILRGGVHAWYFPSWPRARSRTSTRVTAAPCLPHRPWPAP
jgi:uncharacterized membrane protein YqiK